MTEQIVRLVSGIAYLGIAGYLWWGLRRDERLRRQWRKW